MQRLEEGRQGAAKPSLLDSGPSEETGGESILASLEQGRGGAAHQVTSINRRLRLAAYGATVTLAFVVAGWLVFDRSKDAGTTSIQVAKGSSLAIESAASAPAPADVAGSPAAPSALPQADAAIIFNEVASPQAAGAASVVAGAAIASGLTQADAQRPLSASLEKGLTPQAPNVNRKSEAGSSNGSPRAPAASRTKTRELREADRKNERKSERKKAEDRRKNATATAQPKREKRAPVDGDVVLLSALVAHTADPAPTKAAAQKRATADARARPANDAKRKELAKAGNDPSNHDIVERNYGDTTHALLQRCKKLGLFEGELCRLRICSGQWESDAACRVQQP